MCQNESKYNEEELLAVPAENYRDFETVHGHDRKKYILRMSQFMSKFGFRICHINRCFISPECLHSFKRV